MKPATSHMLFSRADKNRLRGRVRPDDVLHGQGHRVRPVFGVGMLRVAIGACGTISENP